MSRQSPLKVLCVFGTRPEATKMAPVIMALRNARPFVEVKVLVTGQHRFMLDQVLDYFGIRTDYDLDIMTENQSLAETTERVLRGLTPVLERERPDLVLVHGDTATTASAALAAYYLRIPCGHVEAGLRTGDKYAPFPEEMMRKIADHISEMHFAPTRKARLNLLGEGIQERSIFVTGNTAIDALLLTLRDDYVFRRDELNRVPFTGKKNILVEVHRRENFGGGIDRVAEALREIACERTDVQLIVSVHKNPNARVPIERHLLGAPRTFLFEPLDYPDYVNLMKRCYIIVTDSGGVQEEAPTVRVPVVLCREKTERPEALEVGSVVLVGTDKLKLVDAVYKLLDAKDEYERMSKVHNPFGDGKASERIVQAIQYWFGLSEERPVEFA